MQTLKFIPLSVLLGAGFVVGCASPVTEDTDEASQAFGYIPQQGQQGEEQYPQQGEEQVPQEEGAQIPDQQVPGLEGQFPQHPQPQLPQFGGGMQYPGEEEALPPGEEHEGQAPDATVSDDDIQWGFRGGVVRGGGWGGGFGRGWGGGWGGGWRGGGWGRPGWGGGWGAGCGWGRCW